MNATMKQTPLKPSLEQLRVRETELMAQLAEERREMDLRTANVASMAEQLSELRKIIGPLALQTLNLA